MNWRKKSKKDWGRLDLNYKETPFGKIPEHWGVGTILENSKLVTDYVANGSFASLKENVQYKNEPDYAILIRLVDFNNEFDGNFVYLSRHSYDFLKKSKLFGNEIIISNVGANVGKVFKAPSLSKPMSLGPNSIMFIPKGDNDFYYYWMKSRFGQHMLKSIVSGSAQPKFNKTDFRRLEIPVPPINEQKEIGSILRSLDDRIAENKKINHHLVELARSFWQERFSSKQPNGKLGDIIELFDSKRVPLSANQREKMDKTYPYYGATSLMDYVDDYLFDGTYLLLGEDGTVIDKEGYPILQYVWGKFWVNNHAHIMVGKNGFTVESLFVLLKNTCVSSIVTGAVQLKINQANLKSVDVYIPQKEELDNFNSTIEPIFDQLRNLYDEIKSLTTLRDALLPKLMSGEISVAD